MGCIRTKIDFGIEGYRTQIKNIRNPIREVAENLSNLGQNVGCQLQGGIWEHKQKWQKNNMALKS